MDGLGRFSNKWGDSVKRYGLLTAVVAFTMAACAGELSSDTPGGIPSAPSRPPSSVAGHVNITRVQAFIKEGRIQAFVQGELGDGCTSLQSVKQRRTANMVEVTVTSRRQGETCTMIMQYVNEWVALEGPFGPGDYSVRANTRTVQFRVVAAETGLRIEPDPGPVPQPPYLPPGLEADKR